MTLAAIHTVRSESSNEPYSHFTPLKSWLETASRAEHNPVISSTGTSEGACLVIFRITISVRAPLLEKPREICGGTAARVAAVLISLEDGARIVAPSCGPELIRALSIDISCAPDSTAVAGHWTEVHGNIKPINKRYVKEIHVVELVQGIFSQCVRGLPEGLAL